MPVRGYRDSETSKGWLARKIVGFILLREGSTVASRPELFGFWLSPSFRGSRVCSSLLTVSISS